jgi:hypothetical protein
VNLVVVEADRFGEFRGPFRKDPGWLVVLDEANDPSKPKSAGRMFIALRKEPL